MASVPDIDARWQLLAPGVDAYLQRGGWFVSNAGVIRGSTRTVFVDTCATEPRSRRLLALPAGSAPRPQPVSCVITHAHGDHANGAGLVARGGGEVLATPGSAAEIRGGPHTYPQVFTDARWGDIAPPAQVTEIRSHTLIDTGTQLVEVHPVAGPAHTQDDLVVWLPRARVLFTGDLLFADVTPLLFSGSLAGWLRAMEWLRGFDARWLVPGHGPLCTPESAAFTEQWRYLCWLREAVAPSEIDVFALTEVARGRWSRWDLHERHPVNLMRAHAEVHGRPFDVAAAFAAMLKVHGGKISLADL